VPIPLQFRRYSETFGDIRNVVEGGRIGAPRRDKSGLGKRREKEDGRVSAKHLDEEEGRTSKREEVREKERDR